MASVEVLVGPERCRRWSIVQKQTIVAAAYGPGAVGGDPAAGDRSLVRGVRGDMLMIVWYGGLVMSVYAVGLVCGGFIWPSPADVVVAVSAAQLAYMLDGRDWRNLVRTWRPEGA